MNLDKFKILKKNHNTVRNLYSSRSVDNAINKINWFKEFPNYFEIQDNAREYAKIAQAEVKNRNKGNNTSEATMRKKVDSLFWHDILGYSSVGKHFNLIGEKTSDVNDQRADFILGHFRQGDDTKAKRNLMVNAVVEIEDSTYNFDARDKKDGVRQAFDYSSIYRWPRNFPKYIIATNFITFRIYRDDVFSAQTFDLTKLDNEHELKRLLLLFSAHFFLHQNNKIYKHDIKPEDKVKQQATAKAASKLGKLDIIVRQNGYSREESHLLVTRLLFLLFADSTTIFNGQPFKKFLKKIKETNSNDLGEKLTTLFRALNTPKSKNFGSSRGPRFKGYDQFPYIDGNLFEQNEQLDYLNHQVLDTLLDATKMDWSRVNPIIIGSMFEGAINPKRRRSLGAHYTSESNIERVIKPLFLDKLYSEFNTILQGISVKSALVKFKKKLSRLTFLDPACGSGNFLIITYRELRLLEDKVDVELLKANHVTERNQQLRLFSLTSDSLNQSIDDNTGFNSRGEFTKDWHRDKYAVPLVQVNVSQFYGMEVQSYACDIAKVGLWLEDHLMNTKANKLFFNSTNFTRIPIHNSGHILSKNALRVNWDKFVNKYSHGRPVDYILGNPPFIGAKKMKKEIKVAGMTIRPKDDMKDLLPHLKNNGNLDYVCGWYVKASRYMYKYPRTKSCFVSTKSISKGLQAPTLWHYLVKHYQINIDFAYRNFPWDNNGANVVVVIVGFSINSRYYIGRKRPLYHVTTKTHNIKTKYVNHINEYLLGQRWVFVNPSNRHQISKEPKMQLGVLALDDDHYVLSRKEYSDIIHKHPNVKKYIHPRYGADQLLDDRNMPTSYFIYAPDLNNETDEKVFDNRINKVKQYRKTVSKADQKLSDTPKKLKRDRYFKLNILAMARHFKVRDYPVIRFLNANDFITDGVYQIIYTNPSTGYYLFGILSSMMHKVWAKEIMGSLGMGSRYNSNIVYNNLVFPNPTKNQKLQIIKIAKQVKVIRQHLIKNYSLAYLYDGHLPSNLLKAHHKLDKAVDIAYTGHPIKDNIERWNVLIHLYHQHQHNW